MKHFFFYKKQALTLVLSSEHELHMMLTQSHRKRKEVWLSQTLTLGSNAFDAEGILKPDQLYAQLADVLRDYLGAPISVRLALPMQYFHAHCLTLPGALTDAHKVLEIESHLSRKDSKKETSHYYIDYAFESVPHASAVRAYYLALSSRYLDPWQALFARMGMQLSHATADVCILNERLITHVFKRSYERLVILLEVQAVLHIYIFHGKYFLSSQICALQKLNDVLNHAHPDALFYHAYSESCLSIVQAYLKRHAIHSATETMIHPDIAQWPALCAYIYAQSEVAA